METFRLYRFASLELLCNRPAEKIRKKKFFKNVYAQYSIYGVVCMQNLRSSCMLND